MKKIIKPLFTVCFLLTSMVCIEAHAQVNPLGARYFYNQYLANPAMAAVDSGFTVYLGYRQQAGNIEGAPKVQSVSGTYRFNQLGLGINLQNELAGILQQTRAVATLSYHLPVGSEEQQLHFGISAGVMNDHINTKRIIGDQDDALIGQMNQNTLELDGDVGLAYSDRGFNIQAALPGFNTIFSKTLDKSLNRATFFTAISYRFMVGEEASPVGIEPKLCYRGLKGYDNIMDIGARISFLNDILGLQGIYHSSKNFTGGISASYQSKFSLILLYNSQPRQISDYADANLELGIKLNL